MKNKDLKFFSERLKLLRNINDWTMDELAFQLGITKQAVSAYERGKKKPSKMNIAGITALFDIPSSFFKTEKLTIEIFKGKIQIIENRESE